MSYRQHGNGRNDPPYDQRSSRNSIDQYSGNYNNDRNDRFPRGRDSGQRDRSKDRDRDRDRASANMAQASTSTFDMSTKYRPDPPTASAMSGSNSPSLSTRPNSKPTVHDVSKAFRSVIDTGLERVQLRHEEQALDELSKKKEDEYQRGQHRQAEYPSIGEAHQRFLYRQSKQRENLKRRRDHNDGEYNRRTEALANDLVNALPALVEKREAQKSADPGQIKCLQDKVDSLSRSTDSQKIEFTSFKSKQKTLEDDNKRLGKRVEILETEKTTLSEQCKSMSKLLGSVSAKMEAMEKAIEDEKTARASDIRSMQGLLGTRCSALEEENMKLKQELLGYRGEVTSLQEALNNEKVRTDGHRTELQELRQTQQDRATSIEGTVATLSSKIDSLNTSTSSISSKIEAQATKIEAQAGLLSTLQAQARATSVESRNSDKNKPKPTGTSTISDAVITGLRTDIKSARDEIQKLEQKVDLETSTRKAGGKSLTEVFGKLIDDMRKANSLVEQRVVSLETSSGSGAQDPAMEAKLATAESEIQVLHSKFDAVHLAVTSLDQQINNLTTNDLSDQIVARMQLMVPNSQQLQDDVAAMAQQMQGFDTVLEQKMEQKMEKLYSSYNYNYQATHDNTARSELPTSTSKKRRMDGAVNGHRGVNGVANGHGR